MFINLFSVLFSALFPLSVLCAVLCAIFFAKDKVRALALIAICMALYMLFTPQSTTFTKDITSVSDGTFNSVDSLVEDILNTVLVNSN